MNVEQMIEYLKNLPGDMPVFMADPRENMYEVRDESPLISKCYSYDYDLDEDEEGYETEIDLVVFFTQDDDD